MPTPTSQNGWPVVADSSRLEPLEWVTGRVLPGDVYTVLEHLCARFDAEVEPIVRAHSWGWAYRPIRGQSGGYSNHASATALDLNAPAHPLGKRGTFTQDQVIAIHGILADLDGVIRWGGDYQGRPDEMHFEINAQPSAVARVAEKIRSATPAARRRAWLADRRATGKRRPRPLTIRVANAMSVSAPPAKATRIYETALTKAGPHGAPDIVLLCELADVDAQAAAVAEAFQVIQRGPKGSPDSALGIAARRGRVALSEPRMIPGTNATRDRRGGWIRARPILTAIAVADPGSPRRWARKIKVGHAPPERAPRARLEYLRDFAKAGAPIGGGDLNIGHRWAARLTGKRVRSAGVLHLALPWWIPATKAARVDIGSDHHALDVTLWPSK